MKRALNFYCPALKRFEVVLECEITKLEESIQIATPYRCWHMKRNGCTQRNTEDCLLGKDVQGNFTKDLERRVITWKEKQK